LNETGEELLFVTLSTVFDSRLRIGGNSKTEQGSY
jgi:hypothetical protein